MKNLDQESNQKPLGAWGNAQPTEPQQPEPTYQFLKLQTVENISIYSHRLQKSQMMDFSLWPSKSHQIEAQEE